ncbi:hypothetical protein V6N13_109649 [Hibiscus sabdariffa]|uniref:Uncharacterized protein n=1 Tax=Hibiscus sabdariffa TaxID=183260 RepID=A0ABR2FQ71_9ROSI
MLHRLGTVIMKTTPSVLDPANNAASLRIKTSLVGQYHVVAVRNKVLLMEAWVQRPEAFMETTVVLLTERKHGTPRKVKVYRMKTDFGQRDGSDAGVGFGGISVLEIK